MNVVLDNVESRRREKLLRSDEARLRLMADRREVINALIAESGSEELAEEWQERDSPSEDELREIAYGRRELLLRRLHRIDEALERIRSGVYGKCTRCRRPIGSRRLAIDPAIDLCIGCQAHEEIGRPAPSL